MRAGPEQAPSGPALAAARTRRVADMHGLHQLPQPRRAVSGQQVEQAGVPNHSLAHGQRLGDAAAEPVHSRCGRAISAARHRASPQAGAGGRQVRRRAPPARLFAVISWGTRSRDFR
jgi:hypothetical protein